ncbi:hypothetical protein MACH09_16070 [Vibrio sp. MACH09]|uniref:hypothetical protein n=1 Tax=Vibrio sp. MACH09 TaxID=3025122 RepID=UPI00278F2D79|nr:hypothetical protein [Vibrio sp. MACH09]GLO61099.1 hypothetical protein MACH09_16070 [Vibrio sp. MACH09]
MQLKEANDIIELTDTDTLSHALEKFNSQGVISNELLPFLSVIFETAPEKLSNKLKQTGFKGNICIAKSRDAHEEVNYIVFDSERHNLETATLWLKQQL